jgi:hypothetical protein
MIFAENIGYTDKEGMKAMLASSLFDSNSKTWTFSLSMVSKSSLLNSKVLFLKD